jgi:hypothetical protein
MRAWCLRKPKGLSLAKPCAGGIEYRKSIGQIQREYIENTKENIRKVSNQIQTKYKPKLP